LGQTLRPVIALTIALAFLGPLVLGLGGTLASALGWFPGSLAGMRLFDDPRWWPATQHTLWTGLASTALALGLTLAAVVVWWGRSSLVRVQRLLPAFLAVPHAALAVGLVFLLAPSGWWARLLAPVLEWSRPSDAWVVPDAHGISLILGLALKEFPFLLLTALAYLPRLQPNLHLAQGRLLGYAPGQVWMRVLFPPLMRMMRLPVAVVLAYNLTVVDMALILGPGQPPTLAVWVVEYFYQAGGRAQASVAALYLLGVLLLGFALAECLYRLSGWLLRPARTNGRRQPSRPWIAPSIGILVWWVLVTAAMALASLLVWSLSQRWRFPDIWPSQWTERFWLGRWSDWAPLLENSLGLALVSSLLALASAVAWLELERHRQVPKLDALWYLPLFLPQVCVLLGWQAAALLAGADGAWITLVWAHWMYAMPYALLMLASPWRALGPEWDRQARLLGAGYFKRLFRVRLGLLLRPVLTAWAVAMAVSIAQYLPTLLLGAGRHPTLTTELVTSFGGVDRRVIGTLASLQMLLPALAFALALLLPAWLYRNRRHA